MRVLKGAGVGVGYCGSTGPVLEADTDKGNTEIYLAHKSVSSLRCTGFVPLKPTLALTRNPSILQHLFYAGFTRLHTLSNYVNHNNNITC